MSSGEDYWPTKCESLLLPKVHWPARQSEKGKQEMCLFSETMAQQQQQRVCSLFVFFSFFKGDSRNDKTKTSYLISFVFGRPARRNLLNLCCSHQKLSTNFAIQCQIPNEIHRVKMLGFFRSLSLLPLSFCSMVL